MNIDNHAKHLVAVVGAGPAGLFASRQLATQGVHVFLFNRDIKPGGLAEYGIYPDKLKMKEGLRKQFQQILENPNIEYYGNIAIGAQADLTLADLRALGFQAILVTVGAQGTKWLGLPGENLHGVYHAKDLVYHYNQLPPFSSHHFNIGRSVAIVGVGNVMMDIAHWLIRERKVDEVIAVARRGPAEVKFTKKEMENVAANLDLAALDKEFARVTPVMRAVNQSPEESKNFILSAIPKALESVSTTRFHFEFLASPRRILGGERGLVRGLEVEDTTLFLSGADVQSKGLGSARVIPADTVIFCIGDRVEDTFGLPVRKNEFVKHPEPRFPVDGNSYEAYNPDLNRPVDRVFVAGWSRAASSGLVGVARKDGENGALAILQYLQTVQPLLKPSEAMNDVHRRLEKLEKPLVDREALKKLDEAEKREAARLEIEAFKFGTNEEMLGVLGISEQRVESRE